MAVRSKANFKSTWTTTFADNTAGLITPSQERDFKEDIADSAVFITDGVNPDLIYSRQEEFLINNLSETSSGGTSAGSTVGINSTEKAIGVARLQVSAIGDYITQGLGSIANQSILFGLGHVFTIAFRSTIDTLSDGTNRFKLNIGFCDVFTNADPANGAYFRYSDNINGGKYQCVTVQGSTETVSDSGITPVVTVNNVFQVQVDSTGTHVYFSIDGVIIQTHTANIPIGAAQFTSGIFKIYKTLGAAARNFYIDWAALTISRTTAR